MQLLTTLKNCLVTPHSAWLTAEAINEIATVTLANATIFAAGVTRSPNLVPMPA